MLFPFLLSGRGDSNSRPLGPEPSALAGLSHAPYFVMLFWLPWCINIRTIVRFVNEMNFVRKILHFVLDKFLFNSIYSTIVNIFILCKGFHYVIAIDRAHLPSAKGL